MAFLSLTTKQQEDIENILNLWIGKVTWALLVKRIEFKLDVVTTRQTLAKYPTISRAYEESKLRSRSKGMSLQEVTNFTKSDIELIERVRQLEVEKESWKKKAELQLSFIKTINDEAMSNPLLKKLLQDVKRRLTQK
jgi:hypothetical protein